MDLATNVVTPPRDRFLRLVRIVLTGAMGACLVAPLGLAAGFAVVLDHHQRVAAGLRVEMPALEWTGALFLLIAVMAVLAFFLLRTLRRIVDSVAEGDPFAPVNADRLEHMGWLMIALQLVAIPMTSLAIWFDAAPFKPNVHHGDDGLSAGAILLTLILFVLARVFRTGAAMRETLEGTV